MKLPSVLAAGAGAATGAVDKASEPEKPAPEKAEATKEPGDEVVGQMAFVAPCRLKAKLTRFLERKR